MPTLLLVILALFGLASIQNLTGPAPRPDSSTESKGEKEASPAAASRPGGGAGGADPADRILGPLLDYYRTGADGEDARRSAFERSRSDHLRLLIATIPDPARGSNSNRFDEWIGTIQRACESEGFVLVGFRIPWGSRATAEPGPAPSPRGVRLSANLAGITAEARVDARRPPTADDPDRDPGLLLFRGEEAPDSPGVIPMLAVLLVRETPTLGIDKAAMARCLELAATWDVRNRPPAVGRAFSVLGPIFSGSQTSLEQVLAGWASRADAAWIRSGSAGPIPRPAAFRILSGGASAIDARHLKGCVRWPHAVEFRATVHHSQVLLRAVIEHLAGPSGTVAMMVEANTGFGMDVDIGTRAEKERMRIFSYPFPLHISKVRSSYQKKGALGDPAGAAVRSFEQLTIPFDEPGEPGDVPPMQTPGFTTAVDELVLGQILADILRRGIRNVGIIATDPLDTIFLAREVRKILPDVRLFTVESDLLYTHPQNVDDLRGMLVASTYPLYPPNQSWSYSYRGDTTHVFFSSDAIQGTYNAAIAHLDELDLGDRRRPARFLEYGTPFDPPGSFSRFPPASGPRWKAKARKPPVWIGMVGNHGVYPVRVATDPQAEDIGYLYVHDQLEGEFLDMLRLPRPLGGDQAGAWRRIRDWFRPEYPHLWLYLFVAATAAAMASAGLGLLVHRWAAAGLDERHGERFVLCGIPMAGLARALDCCRAGDAARPGHCRGPGPYLPIGLFLVGLAYVAICLPHLETIARVPWIISLDRREALDLRKVFDPREVAPFVAGPLALATLVALSASFLISLVTWRATWDRWPSAAAPATRLRRWMSISLIAVVGLVLVGLPVARIVEGLRRVRLGYDFPRLTPGASDALIHLSRWTAIPGGVSPMLSMVFLGVAVMAWVHAQWRRRLLLGQFTPGAMTRPPSSGPGRPSGDVLTMQAIRDEGERIEAALSAFARPTGRGHLAWTVAAAAALAIALPMVIVPVVLDSWPSRWDGSALTDAIAGLLIVVVFVLLGYHTLQLVALWRHVRRVMGLVLRLPMVPALDRIPSRVAGWLKAPPRPGDGRFELIRRQALALAEAGEAGSGAVRGEDAALLRRFTARRWKALHRALGRLRPANADGAIVPLRDYLLEHWKAAPVEEAFPDGESKKEGTGEGGPGAELRTVAAAISGKPVALPRPPKRLPEWVRLAEDLLAMAFLRWLAAALAQVWTLIGFLVVGSIALLFAVSSYPFPFQERLLVVIGMLVAVLAFMILAIAVGFNRDEMISRLSNTAPNRLKLDQQFLGHLVAYVIPLVGALAAISPDVSDTLRTLLDPIFRHLR